MLHVFLQSLRAREGRGWPGIALRDLIPTILCLPLGIAAAVTGRFAIELRDIVYPAVLGRWPELAGVFPPDAMPPLLYALGMACAASAWVFGVASLAGFVRRGRFLRLLRSAYLLSYALLALYAGTVFSLTGRIEALDVSIAGVEPDAVGVFFWRYYFVWPAACVAAVIGLLHLLSYCGVTVSLYAGAAAGAAAAGDRILENVRTHGRDPRFRKSTLTSLTTHLMVIVIIPLLLRMVGCVDPYRPPFGGGNPVVKMVRMVKPKKKKRKKYILRPDAAIYFHRPDLDDSKILQEVEEETRLTYQADPNAAHGPVGDGTAGTPGWQDGFKDGVVRFIRLEYNGANWDDGMDSQSRADMNFLDAFKRLTGGIKTARNSESHPIRQLKKYPKGQAPPFVYMTGSDRIYVSSADLKVLREYLLAGGMLFADCGSRRWDYDFRPLMQSLFPGNALRVIADDDPVFQMPFGFPNGAPPLWHHGGNEAMGIKVNGRWVVFYHPGDMNDAWKTGHSGMDPELAEASYQLGVNVVYYSFVRYMELNRRHR